MTSTMKSEPGWSITVALTGTEPLVVAVWALIGRVACCASVDVARTLLPTAVAPATATPRRKSRRLVAIAVWRPPRLPILRCFADAIACRFNPGGVGHN